MNKEKNIELFDLLIIPGGDTGSSSSKWLNSFNIDYPRAELIRYSDIQYFNEDFYFIKYLSSCSWNEKEFPSQLNVKIFNVKYLM